MTESAGLDFSPFDAEANLKALCRIVRALRQISWSYAGDVERLAKLLATTFDAGRCAIFVSTAGDVIDVFEYTGGSLEPLYKYFESVEGQRWLCVFLESSREYVPHTTFANLTRATDAPTPDALLHPPSFIFPLRQRHDSRFASKPGLLLLQESTGLARWDELFLESVVVLADYLGTVIECDRLAG